MYIVASMCLILPYQVDVRSSVPSFRNLFDSVQKLTWLIGGSAKRKEIFLGVSSSLKDDRTLLNLLTEVESVEPDEMSESAKAVKEGGKKKTVPKFCATRWTAQVSTLSALLSKYVEVVRALEKIRLKYSRF